MILIWAFFEINQNINKVFNLIFHILNNIEKQQNEL